MAGLSRIPFRPALPLAFGALAAASLAGCGTVQNETYSTVSTFYNTYQVRTRVIEQGGQTYTTSSVRVNGFYYPCLIDSPGDCEAAARRGENRFDRGSRL